MGIEGRAWECVGVVLGLVERQLSWHRANRLPWRLDGLVPADPGRELVHYSGVRSFGFLRLLPPRRQRKNHRVPPSEVGELGTWEFGPLAHAFAVSPLRQDGGAKPAKACLSNLNAEHRREGVGIPIGNLTSQHFANIYLDRLDHFLKEKLRIPGYLR